ncbi:MAG: gliding motility-associated C-terminal domain-containing protein [Flavobacteriia bacterium]|nr:gliding motility-associated C-terminal domain-containing protein [Flavobacteriia bacterium]
MRNFLVVMIGIFGLSTTTFAQCSNTCGSNLLTNPGFETPTASCAVADIQLYNSQTPVAGWFGTDDYPGAGSSPDYFSPCAGTTNSANSVCITGNARVGVFTKTSFNAGREYVQSQLTAPLQAGKTYCFSMVVKSRVGGAGNLLSSCDGIGAWFHNQGLINIQTMNGGTQFLGAGSAINATPQVNNPAGNMIGASCVTVTGTFCAQGGEDRIVIGNFNTDAGTQINGSSPSNYMYIDDVALFELCNPTLDLTASSQTIACGGNSTLTVNSTFPAGTTYTWLAPVGNTLTGLGPHNVTPGTTETYTIAASYTNSCGLQTDTSSIEITVGPCGIGATLYDTILCAGNCHNLQAYNLQGGTAPYSIQWTDDAGTILGNTEGPILVCPNATSTYYFSVTDAVGSTFSDSLIFQVNTYPIVNAGYDTLICATATAQLSATTNSGIDQWLTLGFGSSFQVSPLVSTNYIYQADNNGCVSSDTVLITVNQPAQIAVQSTNITCFGASDGTMTVVATGNAPFSYNWYTTPGSNSPTISGLPASWEWVEVTDANGCISIDSALIIQPTALQLSVSGDSVLCLGESTSFTASTTGGTPNYTYNWNNGSGNGTNYSITPTTSGILTVSVTDINGCTTNETVNIQVNPLPVASFTAGIQLCAGADTIIHNTSAGATNVQWFVNGQPAGNATNLSFNEVTAGCYAIQLIAQNQFGCADTVSQPCAVEIQPTPQSVVYPSTHLVLIDNPTVTVFDNSINTNSCSWYLNDQLLSQACGTDFTQSFPDLGVYEFIHYAYNTFGCVDSSLFSIEVREGLIYYVPNAFTPDGDEFNNVFQPVFTSGFDPTNYHLQLFDRWGELIFESYDHQVGWDGTYHGKLAMTGTYTWTITFKDLYLDKRYELVGTVTLMR